MLRLIAIPGLPLLAAAALPAFSRLRPRGLASAAGATTLAALAVVTTLAPRVLAGETLQIALPWAPTIGLALSFVLDGLALLFVLLILVIGLLVVIYARFYLSPDEALGRFYAALLLFMGAMLGVVTADNLLILVVFWELTSLASFLLIGFWDDDPRSRSGAYQALIVTGIGGLALLAGVIVLGSAAGTYELSALRANADAVRALPAAPAALALMLLGAFTKSAQVPFHFWLPSAMAAPTPVSAYLHSATMVKAGIFLLARIAPLFAGTALWLAAVPAVGAATMLVGGWAALRQTDLKALLAYSTISQLGLITMLLGLGSELATVAALLHILNHAAFKAPLFMAAGIVDHETGSRDLRSLGGLLRVLPWTSAILIIAGAAMAGIIPLNGFVSKELIYAAALSEGARGTGGQVWIVLALTGSALTAAYTLRLVVGTCFGPRPSFAHPPHEPPLGLRLSPLLLGAACIVFGLWPALLGPLVDAAASAVRAAPVHAHLTLWHGWNVSLALSAVAFLAGTGWYVARRGTARTLLPPRLGRTASEWYDAGVNALLIGSRWLTDALQTGALRTYVRVVLGLTLALAVSGFAATGAPAVLEPVTPVLIGARLVSALTIIAALAVAAFYRHRLPSVIALAAVGLLVAVYFVWLSAPDLVLTQLLVEAATTILIVLVLYFLPKETAEHERRRRLLADGTLAAVVGATSAAVVYAILRRPFESISSYHLERSLTEAGGGNVVNVILVDFRGYDTLGEITVLAIAAIGVVALVRAGRRPA